MLTVLLLPLLAAQPCAEHDLGRRIDVGVLYTPAAAADWPGGAAQLEGEIDEQLDATNAVFASSGVALRFVAVAMHQTGWNESGPAYLWYSQVCASGPYQAMRDGHGADLVVCYVSSELCATSHVLGGFTDCTGDLGGVACVLTNYSPAAPGSYPCSVYGNLLLQGLGHCLGFGAAPDSPGIFDFSAPYCDSTVPVRFHSADMAGIGGCTAEVPLLSSPLVLYLGEPAGDPWHDDARTAEETRLFVSRYRDQVHCPADHDGDGIVGIDDLLIVAQEWDGQGILRWLEVFLTWGPC